MPTIKFHDSLRKEGRKGGREAVQRKRKRKIRGLTNDDIFYFGKEESTPHTHTHRLLFSKT